MKDQQHKNWEEIAKKGEDLKDEDLLEDEDEEGGESSSSAQLEHPDYAALEKRLTETESQVHENWDKFMRAQADLDNIRRRMDREVEKAHKYALDKFVRDLLPVVDSLETSIVMTENADESQQKLMEGVEMTLKLFMGALKKFSVEPIDPLGTPFDPTQHEAVATQENAEMEPNHVMQVLQKGYSLNGRVIRPAMVIVTKAK